LDSPWNAVSAAGPFIETRRRRMRAPYATKVMQNRTTGARVRAQAARTPSRRVDIGFSLIAVSTAGFAEVRPADCRCGQDAGHSGRFARFIGAQSNVRRITSLPPTESRPIPLARRNVRRITSRS
jgi:hypothetical protein